MPSITAFQEDAFEFDAFQIDYEIAVSVVQARATISDGATQSFDLDVAITQAPAEIAADAFQTSIPFHPTTDDGDIGIVILPQPKVVPEPRHIGGHIFVRQPAASISAEATVTRQVIAAHASIGQATASAAVALSVVHQSRIGASQPSVTVRLSADHRESEDWFVLDLFEEAA